MTGKYHPPDDLVEGGTCIHTKKVTWLACKFFGAYNEDTDIGVCAALLHDIRSRGAGDEVGSQEDYDSHAEAARLYLWDYADKNFSFLGSDTLDKWTKVLACVAHHMGKYEKDASPPTEIRPMLLHLADVAASFRLLVGLPFYTDDLPKINDIMESAQKFVQRGGIWLINFGKKHYRKPVMDIMETDPGYFDWILKSDFEEDVCKQVRGFQAEYKVMLKRKIQLETGNLPLG